MDNNTTEKSEPTPTGSIVGRLPEILLKHVQWLQGNPEGKRADLSGAYLSGADLSRANLSRANLSEANLSGANLSRADLSRANLSRANLSGADLFRANLSEADLSGANLSGANLSGADLFRADLFRANLFGQKVNGLVMGGECRRYRWILAQTETGLWLQFGCETRNVTEWESQMEKICESHEPGNNYEKTITALINFCRSCL